MHAHAFRAMGTSVEVHLDADDPSAAFAAAEAEFERLEQIMSRFRADSELSRLNEAGSLEVSADLADVVGLALAARERSGGLFDPTVHDALVGAGYDRSFDDLPADREGVVASAPCAGAVAVEGHRVSVEPGFHIDLGGIGKGFAAERVAELISSAGPCLVNAGGDVAVRGLPPDGVWPVSVDGGVTLGLERGGLATSGAERRRWQVGGADQHHLIDPRTGRPATTDLARVTAVADTAAEAEVLAKTLFLEGTEAAAARGVPAVLVTADGRTITTGGI